jgi:hypothetical protein
MSAAVGEYRTLSHTTAAARIDNLEAVKVTGPSGRVYQIEVQMIWDGKPNGDVRVLGSIDDGGWRAFLPLTETLLIQRDAAGEHG